ncbi:MAG: D-arabinono-1,4-lactone oxidase [Pseudomonadota bacterium]
MDEFLVIPKGADGYYHPKNESEVIALVKYAVNSKRQIRVRGASHSTAWSIFTDPVDDKPRNMTLIRRPPAGENLNLSLDQMIALDWIDEANGIVEAEAGIHLGADPYDPLAVATLDNSLLYQLFQKGWGINDLGGITHQTVGGFLGTGSAGGSLKFDLDNVTAFRIVDGTGTPSWIERTDPIFGAVAVSMGLLGIVTKVRLRCNRSFIIAGDEVTTPTTLAGCPIDLFGSGTAGKPSMQQFLEEKDYSRILWWPQVGAERVVIWEAKRDDAPPPPGFTPVPYQEFATDLAGWAEQLLGSIFYVLLGNTAFGRITAILLRNYGRFCHCVARMWAATLGPLAWLPAAIVTAILFVILLIPTLIFMLFPGILPKLFPTALNFFQPMTKPGEATLFKDYYWRSLPMDNTADDILMGTEFTEIWMPLKYTQQCMTLLNQMFIDKGVTATGYFSAEVYATMPSTAWLSPAYSDGNDEYKDGVVRFDIFWYRENDGQPNVEGGFYQQYWDLFRSHGIPFRFHWGKYIPAYNFPDWAAYIRAGLPKFDDFMALRAARDPNDIFYTQYYRERFTGHA